ncbi:sulfate ABC transporter substrate-binding protein [Nocardioides baekrokdamisoli]|uniref:Sulfate ABC transporter substrate-binding protein n=1 Tax=Nocardioides baekrokdamisoli TaxID=1804624 RepID=A0A3G9J3T6_9ACTN|nr:extracellular solute-binding protein [Nocardioides baekrokdamisoli]BBH17669.1 sulfate ABC transporter substrate-binding protein [Nocardioides baekrokdamisoli]
MKASIKYAAVAFAGVVSLTACGSSSSANSINLVGYSVPKPAYDALATAFQATPAGKGVSFNASYGPSGSQAKAVANGNISADYVNFSTSSDLKKLVPGQVAEGWDSGATKGIVADSVVVIVVRKGNPLHITGWNDLIKPGVKIVTPDPASSGSAKWNILAAYEHVISDGGTKDQAKAYLTAFFKNVTSRADSGSVATQQFLNGTGDVLISYEAEAIAARAKGADVDYIVPNENILIQTPAAVTTTASQSAKDFLAFAESAAGQAIFAAHGFRPALTGVKAGTVNGAANPADPYPTLTKLITIKQLGGWTAVNAEFFGDHGLVTAIESAK